MKTERQKKLEALGVDTFHVPTHGPREEGQEPPAAAPAPPPPPPRPPRAGDNTVWQVSESGSGAGLYSHETHQPFDVVLTPGYFDKRGPRFKDRIFVVAAMGQRVMEVGEVFVVSSEPGRPVKVATVHRAKVTSEDAQWYSVLGIEPKDGSPTLVACDWSDVNRAYETARAIAVSRGLPEDVARIDSAYRLAKDVFERVGRGERVS